MRRTLIERPDLSVQLASFPAGARQSRHTDRCSRVTLVLGGAFREEAFQGSERFGIGATKAKGKRTSAD